MGTTISFNGTNHLIPAVGDRLWGQNVTNFLIAVGQNALSKAGGSFTLTADANFGANYGLLAKYFKSVSSNISTTGVIRLANNEGIGFRNAANNADLVLKVDSSDKLAFGSSAVSEAEFGYVSGVTSSIQTQLNSKASSTDLSNHEADTSTHGVGTVAGLTETQVFTNKDYDGGTASNTSRITVPKAATSTLNGLTRKQGTLLYDTTLLKLLVDDGSNLQQVGTSSSGINLISSPNDAGSWAASGSGVTVATTTTTAELPLAGVLASAIKITAVSGTDYARIRWTMPSALKEWKIPVSWYQLVESGYASGDFKVDVYTNTASDYSGSYTRKTLSSDSSSVTSIPASTGFFGAGAAVSFDAGSEDYYELRITRVSGTKYITLANVKVGPGDQSVVPAAGVYERPTSFTIGAVTTAPTLGTGATAIRSVSRDADGWATIRYEVRQTVAGTAGSGDYLFPIPTGLTIDFSRLATANSTNTQLADVGTGTFTINGAYGALKCYAINSGAYANKIYCLWFNDATTFTTWGSASASFANAGIIGSFTVRVPIAEWAGSVSTGPAPAEEWAADDGSADVFGPSGALVPNVAASTGTTTRVFTFQYPQQVTQSPNLEYYNGNGWANASDLYPFQGGNNSNANNFYGVRGYWSSSTQYTVEFGNQGTRVNASNADAGSSSWATRFSAGDRFRVSKCNRASLPYANASADASGLYPAKSGLARIRLRTTNGYGSTNTCIRRFSTTIVNTGSGITYADSATLGASFTITESGVYSFTYSEQFSASNGHFGLSLNSTQLSTNIVSLSNPEERLNVQGAPTAELTYSVYWSGYLVAGDVVRPHADSNTSGANPGRCSFTAQRIS